MSERKTSFIFERGEKMTRRELRENVFKMLFRVEFFDAGELSEQLVLFGEEVDHVTDQDFKYVRSEFGTFKKVIEKNRGKNGGSGFQIYR